MEATARPHWSLKVEVIALAALLALICLLAYPGMSSQRLLDDKTQLEFVKEFRSWKDIFGPDAFGLFRPVKNLLFYLSGEWSLPVWHGFNLGTFLLTVVGVHLLLRRILGNPAWGLIGAALWATSPTQVSAAVWMTCFNLNLAVAAGCAFLIGHDHVRTKDRAWFASLMTGLLLVTAQVCYESAVALPLIAIIVDLLRKRPIFTRAAILRYGIYGGLTMAYLIVRSSTGARTSAQGNFGFSPDLELWQLALSAPWFFWRHLSMWLMPFGRIEYCSTYLWGVSAPLWVIAASWVFLAAFFAVIVWTWKRQPWISLGLLWFFVASFPSSNFVPIFSGPIEDYYLIAPSIGLVIALLGCARLLIALRAERSARSPQYGFICGGLLALGITWRALGIPLFWLQAGLWQNPIALYLSYEATRPAQFQLQAIAARLIMEKGNVEVARQLAEQSFAIAPWNPHTLGLIGVIALTEEEYDKAISNLDQCMSRSAPHSSVHQFCRLRKADALMARPETRHLVRETLLPLLEDPTGEFHLDAVHTIVKFYLGENKEPQARNAVMRGLQHHPGEKSLLADLETIDRANSPQTSPTQ
ncbi:MAG: hypothetical protein V4819_19720 [Verrucomicrobiota bacterium]